LPEPATHWVRADDWGEYHGVYLYSQTPDGKLWFTHYPENSTGGFEAPRHVGFWTQTNGSLDWRLLNGSNYATYIMNTNGTYVETNGHYYFPVELMPVPVKDGKPEFEY